MAKTYDAIVVGSGISGGWAAKELCEAGLETLVLEAGRPVNPDTDSVEHVPVWQMKFRGNRDRKAMPRRQPVQPNCYACDELASKFFVDDLDNPYTTDEGKPFLWIRGRQVGGRSIMWGRQTYRWSDLDFEANAKDGFGVDWPIRYADIAPWYDHVERFVGISGQAEGLGQLPDGQFLPPMGMTCAETHVRDAVAKYWGRDRVVTIGRCAVLTQSPNGGAACHYCGPCHRGCVTRSYFSSINATLPAAQATGKLTLRPYSVVHSVIYDPAKKRAAGVRVVDAHTKHLIEFRGRVVFLCASALESARILLHSTSPEFPNGLANSSGQLGKNLMDHCMGGGADGTIPGYEDRTTYGNRPNGIYMPRFRNVKDRSPNFLRGYGYQGGAGREGWGRGVDQAGFGADFKRQLKELGRWNFGFYGFGECLPRPENYIELDPAKTDAWGIPALKIHCAWSDNERALLKDMSVAAAEMLSAAGATDIRPYVQDNAPGLTIHEMGTARMGRDPKTSVLNGNNQAWDAPNLFLTDGACMASSSCVNPSITYMALTARACHYAVVAWTAQPLRRDLDGWKRVGETFTRAGDACHNAGLTFAFHNHSYEFVPLEGQLPYDVLLAATDPALVKLEMDLFWITFGGQDPLAYFAKHPGRFPLVHVKDMTAKPRPDIPADSVMRDVGKGSIDWKRIFARSEQAGIRHYFVEHDSPGDALASSRASFEYLKALDF